MLLYGCGGGSDGAAGPAGVDGPAGPAGPGGGGGAPVAGNVVNLAQLSAAQFAATEFNATVTGVTIASPPVVTFKVADQFGNPIVGLGVPTKAANATVPRYQNIAFALAKLVPGTPGIVPGTTSPSKWVSYIVTTVPTTTAAATGTRPSTDSNGTLVDNKDGTYKYTFFRDITQVKAQVAALTLTGNNVAADLGDLTYDANAVHRLVVQISGNVPGTGTNTPNELQLTPGVPLARPNNAVFDFIPATGKVLTAADAGQRLIVDKASCNECHGKLGGIPGTDSAAFHGGSRYDPRFCVACHTDQRKYGRARVTSTNNVFTAADTSVADGVTIGDFPVLIHRVHKGELLVKEGYNYAGVKLNHTRFPQDVRNCDKCHDGTAPKVAPQAANFKTVPSRLACGACHDGINFATGQGVTNAAANQAKITGTTPAATGHIGGLQNDDTRCALCHDANSIEKVYHLAITPPNPVNSLAVTGGNNNTAAAWIASKTDNLPPGAIKVSYDISSVSRNANKQPVIVFRMLQNGVAVPFNTFGAKTEMWDNFMGAPSAYFVFSVPQDGIAEPTDFNASASSYLRSIWNGSATGSAAGTMTGPDANGFYTVTLTGVTIPDNAKMLTGGIGYSYGLKASMPLTQTNLSDSSLADATRKPRFGVAPATATDVIPGMPNQVGGLIVIAPDVQKVATGYTGRRAIVDDKRCAACHEELGAFTIESFHAGQRNDGASCSWCHTPNRASSGWTADSTSFIHAIHGGGKRETKFTWHSTTTDHSYGDIGYPGILSKCDTCHLPGTSDFSASASGAQAGGRLLRTVATGTPLSLTANPVQLFSASPYITAGTNYGSGFSFSAATGNKAEAAATTLVNSPTTAVCFSCHDSTLAQAHMRTNGGSIYAPRSAALVTQEQCLLCHGPGKLADIKAVHSK